jgi:hypothetical protein
LGLHFSDFFTIFYAFYKTLQNIITIEDTTLLPSPLKELKSYRKVLALQLCIPAPGKIHWLAIGPLGGDRRGSPESSEASGCGRPGVGRGWPGGSLGSTPSPRRGGGRAGDGPRRRKAATGTAAGTLR